MDWKATFENLLNTVIAWASTAGIKILVALVILFVSFKVVNVIARKIEKMGANGKLDKTLAKTFAYIFKLGLKIIIAICLVGYVGIDTSGLAALVTSLGVCAGLALNGALANLAGGVLIILTRPFKVDDFIEAQGYSGTVDEIHITVTKIITPDNKVIYIPNGALSSGNIVNYSVCPTRRVDVTFSIGYADDFEKAKAIVLDICNAHELILKDPAPAVKIAAYSASSVDISVRAWAKNEDYWTVNGYLMETVKAAFDKEGIEIPFNQLDVHIKSDAK